MHQEQLQRPQQPLLEEQPNWLRRPAVRGLAILAASILLTTTACTAGGGDSTGSGATGPAEQGGTLSVLGTGDIDHLDPALTAFVPVASLMRATTRQLISYKTVADAEERLAPQGDLATEVPEPTNGGLTYTFTIRDGAQWDVAGDARPIVAADFIRGFQRLCNPFQASPMLGYYVDLIEGMQQFCDGFAEIAPDAAPMKEYIDANSISGLTAIDDSTLQIDLTEAAGDFVYMLSLSPASPMPEEVLDYIPDSPEFRANFISSGPYTVASYTPDKSLVLKRNPAWDAKSDPLRQANVDEIEMTFGLTSDAIMQQLQAGSGDVLFDTTPAPAIVQQLKAANDPKLSFVASGGVNPNIWINTQSPNNGFALQNLKVRQALEFAVDKAAVVQTLGGADVAVVQNGIFGPGVLGFHEFDMYPSDDGHGDPDKARQLLSEAGYPDGLTLKMPFRTKDQEPAIAQTIQASLERAGFTIELIPVNPTDYYSNYLINRDSTASGVWDIAPTGWTPDWQGGAARSVFQPQYTFTGSPQTYNYVDYNNDEANALAAEAIQATDPATAAELWNQVDETVMKDAVVIPIASQLAVLYHSERVQNFLPYALSVQGDWTTLWLKK